jgi:hypothetical protein
MYKGYDNQNKTKHLTNLTKLDCKNETLIKVCKKCNFLNNYYLTKNRSIFCYKCNNPITIL